MAAAPSALLPLSASSPSPPRPPPEDTYKTSPVYMFGSHTDGDFKWLVDNEPHDPLVFCNVENLNDANFATFKRFLAKYSVSAPKYGVSSATGWNCDIIGLRVRSGPGDLRIIMHPQGLTNPYGKCGNPIIRLGLCGRGLAIGIDVGIDQAAAITACLADLRLELSVLGAPAFPTLVRTPPTRS